MDCPICYEHDKNIFYVKLPCNHSLCLSCLVSLEKRSCPVCRYDFEKIIEKTIEKINKDTKDELVKLIKDS